MLTFSFVLQQLSHNKICLLVVMVMWFAWVIWEEFFSKENTSEGNTETHKGLFYPYKQVSGRNGDHEWHRMTNAFICNLLWKVQKSHAANREGSFNYGVWRQITQWDMSIFVYPFDPKAVNMLIPQSNSRNWMYWGPFILFWPSPCLPPSSNK